MWIKYKMPGETEYSFTPVCHAANGGYMLADGAYDVYDYFYHLDDDGEAYDVVVDKMMDAMPSIIDGEMVRIEHLGLVLDCSYSDDE